MLELLLRPELVVAYGLNGPHDMKISLNRKLVISPIKIHQMLPKDIALLKEILPKMFHLALRANEHHNQTIIGSRHIPPKQIHGLVVRWLYSLPIVLAHEDD